MNPTIAKLFSASLMALTLTAGLAGCGSGEDAIDGAASKPNSFPPNKNPANNFGESSTGDSDNSSGLKGNEIVVSLEVPMAESGNGEETRRGLKIVQPDRLDIYRTNQDLRQGSSVDYSRRTDESERTIITFEDGQPQGPDVVIEASYNGQILRALATDQDRDVKINPFSEYLVAEAVGGYTEEEFSQVMECLDADADFCLNRYVWAVLADQVHDFEIEIPDNRSIEQAVDFLDTRADFKSFITNMADYARIGQDRAERIGLDIEDLPEDTGITNLTYNSIWFGLSLSESRWPNGGDSAGQWGALYGTEAPNESTTPNLLVTAGDLFGVDLTLLGSDVPYQRQTWEHEPGNNFDANDEWQLNAHSTSQNPGTIVGKRLLAGRSVFQTVTGTGTQTGWTQNPFYYDAFLGYEREAELPERILAGYFTGGKAIRLRDSGGNLEREQTLENHFVSALDISLEQPADDDAAPTLATGYNAVFFGALTAAAEESAVFRGGFGPMSKSGSQLSFSSATDGTELYEVYRDGGAEVLGRDLTNAGVGLNLSSIAEGRFLSESTRGAIAPSGGVFAANLIDTSLGNGLLIAATPSTDNISSGVYRFQGFVAGQDNQNNNLLHFDNARLEFTSAANATFDLSGFNVVHSVDSGIVSGPASAFMANPQISVAVGAVNSEGFFTLTSNSTELTMTGFASANREQLFFSIRYTEAGTGGNDKEYIGLAIATLDERE
jgi:hypothetical protein